MSSVELDTTRYHNEIASLTKLHESIEEEVKKATIKDLVWDMYNLCSQSRLQDKAFIMVRDAWRKFNPANEIDNLLGEILSQTNYPDFISNLNLEEAFRKMVIDYRYDLESSGL